MLKNPIDDCRFSHKQNDSIREKIEKPVNREAAALLKYIPLVKSKNTCVEGNLELEQNES